VKERKERKKEKERKRNRTKKRNHKQLFIYILELVVFGLF